MDKLQSMRLKKFNTRRSSLEPVRPSKLHDNTQEANLYTPFLSQSLKFNDRRVKSEQKYQMMEWLSEQKFFQSQNKTEQIFYPSGNIKQISTRVLGILQGQVKSYYDNTLNTYKEVANYKDGKKQGVCSTFYYSGNLQQQSLMNKGLFHGKTLIYIDDKNNTISEEVEFKHNLMNGVRKIYYENGSIQQVQTLKNNYLHGNHQHFYDNEENSIKKQQFWDFGIQDGTEKIYSEDGTLEIYTMYKQGNFLWSGFYSDEGVLVRVKEKVGPDIKVTDFYPWDGTGIEKIKQVYQFENLKPFQGKVTTYHESGRIESRCETLDRELNGLRVIYYDLEESPKQEQCDMIDGVKQGILTVYYENGKVSQICNMKENEQNGICKFFYNNQKNSLEEESEWVDGDREGIEKLYCEFTENLKQKAKVYDGSYHRILSRYLNNWLIEKAELDGGFPIRNVVYYMWQTIMCVNDYMSDRMILYSPDGKVMRQCDINQMQMDMCFEYFSTRAIELIVMKKYLKDIVSMRSKVIITELFMGEI